MKVCFKNITMKTIRVLFQKLALVVFVAICMASCSNKSEYRCFLVTRNYTDRDIYIDYTLNDNSTQIVKSDELYSIDLGYVDREDGEDYPSVFDISQKLQHIKIYRKISDSVQYLPKHCYDEANDLPIIFDYFMGIYEAKYFLGVTEEMFSE